MAYSEQLDRKTYPAGDTVVKWVGVPGMPGSTEPNVGTQYLFVKIDPAAKDVEAERDRRSLVSVDDEGGLT